jgi:hypothetical protein
MKKISRGISRIRENLQIEDGQRAACLPDLFSCALVRKKLACCPANRRWFFVSILKQLSNILTLRPLLAMTDCAQGS